MTPRAQEAGTETPRTASAARVALVHDWLTGMRGGEKVLEVLCELYPHADLYTMVYVPGTVSPAIEALHPKGSVLSRLPGIAHYYRHCLPLFPAIVEQFDLDAYDIVVSTSHCAVKSVVRPGSARHLCYCHTPMRYVWDQREAYFGARQVGRPRAALLRPILSWLARWDASTAHRVDRYVANSEHVARRIRRYYNRRASVIHPPVDTVFYHPDGRPAERSALVVSALAPYKRLDVAIEACRLARVPLRIVGWGPELEQLSALAGNGVEFLGVRTDEEVRELYRSCGAVLLPGEEDFGIVPVEAQACGRPVVAAARGGALETVIDGVTGVLVAGDGPEAFAEGLGRALDAAWDPAAIRSQAERFGRARFAARIAAEIDDVLGAPADQD
jgi:glycosyltransferase involved in cell wall biosynthesis